MNPDDSIEQISTVYIPSRNVEGYATSPVLEPRTGHRAFTLDTRHHYMLIPVTGYLARSEGQFSGVAVISYDPTSGKLGLKAILEHENVLRTLYIGDVIYTVASQNPPGMPMVKAFDAETLKLINQYAAVSS
ncbi:hypothetical protein Hbut_1056 [Hyperthermus butylicus DSM 5456]|uniref:Uncharacterized protein n=1 Tax=Hyperthermus butylicus (strain DSM 5456 / JCM 9403 / PLM1-5) TaxID=415426 RepID=A2BLN8_HYPBU|nr:hypothetical protein Hbut_1056 [Hyperthermus butylicus DSM 5456]